MSGPWSKFFWSDWEADQGLRLCSLAAQGLWMRMLCVCARHEPKGHLAIAGNPLDVTAIARLAGVAETEVETLLEELERNGVFSRNRNGCIYSRRMVRDEKRSQEGRKWKKHGLSQVSENERENRQPLRGSISGPSPHIPEARSQNNPLTPIPGDAGAGDDDLLTKLRRRIAAAYHPDIPPDTGYAAVWLAQGYQPDLCAALVEASAQRGKKPKTLRYFDSQLQEAHSRKAPSGAPAAAVPDWRGLLERFGRSGGWPTILGPAPGFSGCRAPHDLLAEFGFSALGTESHSGAAR